MRVWVRIAAGDSEQKRKDCCATDPLTLRAKSRTLGVMPGISAMTMTAGPSPRRKIVQILNW